MINCVIIYPIEIDDGLMFVNYNLLNVAINQNKILRLSVTY